MQNQNIDISKIKAPTPPKDLKTCPMEEFLAYRKAWGEYAKTVGALELVRRGEGFIKY